MDEQTDEAFSNGNEALNSPATPNSIHETELITAVSVEGNKDIKIAPQESADEPKNPIRESPIPVTDTGILQVTTGITLASIAILAIIPSATSTFINTDSKIILYVFIGLVCVASVYVSLWFLAEYTIHLKIISINRRDNFITWFGFRAIWRLLTHPSAGPYWLLAVMLICIVPFIIFMANILLRNLR